jgi:hypothetical protein
MFSFFSGRSTASPAKEGQSSQSAIVVPGPVAGDTRLHALVSYGYEDDQAVADELHHAPWSLNVRNEVGSVPLSSAVSSAYMTGIGLLLRAGANVESPDYSGVRPLHLAVSLPQYSSDVGALLLKGRAEVNSEDHRGQTPLFHAAAAGNTKALQILLQRGALVNHRSHAGDTPLHISLWIGDVTSARLLLAQGARSDILGSQGMTSRQMAKGMSPEVYALVKAAVPSVRFSETADIVNYVPPASQHEAPHDGLGTRPINAQFQSASPMTPVEDTLQRLRSPALLPHTHTHTAHMPSYQPSPPPYPLSATQTRHIPAYIASPDSTALMLEESVRMVSLLKAKVDELDAENTYLRQKVEESNGYVNIIEELQLELEDAHATILRMTTYKETSAVVTPATHLPTMWESDFEDQVDDTVPDIPPSPVNVDVLPSESPETIVSPPPRPPRVPKPAPPPTPDELADTSTGAAVLTSEEEAADAAAAKHLQIWSAFFQRSLAPKHTHIPDE